MFVLHPASDRHPEAGTIADREASPEGRDLVSGVILSEAIAQHPRRGRISLLRNPESGLNPASDRHPEAGTIADREASPEGSDLDLAFACHPEERRDEGSRVRIR